MTLTQALAVPDGRGVTALVGGGGKTTLLYALGAERAARGGTAVVMTTTRILPPTPEQARLLPAEALEDPAQLPAGEVLCAGRPGPDGKLHDPGAACLRRCLKAAGRVFAECDGARRLPVKVPNATEPCFPEETDSVVVVAGLSALGRPLGEVCFRAELAEARFGVGAGTLLTPELLARILTDPDGQCRGVQDGWRFSVLLNQADTPERIRLGLDTARAIQRRRPGCRVVLARLLPSPGCWKIAEEKQPAAEEKV